MAGCGGGLSGLPDDLLRRILYFAPANEGASTSILSRQWGSLWRTSGAVNLDSRSYPHMYMTNRDMSPPLAAAEGPLIRKLTLHVEQHVYENNLSIGSYSGHKSESMLAALLSSPAAAGGGGGVEELRVVIADDSRRDYGNQAELHLGDLPSTASLRLLHVFNCSTLTAPPAAAVFLPRLVELRLQRCGVSLLDLRRIVEGAPQLAILHLECYYYVTTARGVVANDGSQAGAVVRPSCYRIHCPAVTDLVFEACGILWPWKDEGGLELDVPRLQYFRYKGRVHLENRLSLKLSPSSANLCRTDLHFVWEKYLGEQDRACFWELVQSFNATKILKLRLEFNTDHVAVDEKGERLLSKNILFYNLERLELEVPCEPATPSKTSGLFIANLLRCCPVLCDLHIKLTASKTRANPIGIVQARSEFDKSIDHFRQHRKSPKILLNGDADENYMVPDIPGLSGHSFDCLKSYLRTVSLQFWMEEPNCFGVQLAKFFAENAAALQEISIDDGNHKLREHVNRMLRRWAVPSSSKRKNSPTTTAFRESHPRKHQRKD